MTPASGLGGRKSTRRDRRPRDTGRRSHVPRGTIPSPPRRSTVRLRRRGRSCPAPSWGEALGWWSAPGAHRMSPEGGRIPFGVADSSREGRMMVGGTLVRPKGLALKGRGRIATGGAQRNPWPRAVPEHLSAPEGRGRWRGCRSVVCVSPAPSGRKKDRDPFPRVPLVRRWRTRCTRGQAPALLRSDTPTLGSRSLLRPAWARAWRGQRTIPAATPNGMHPRPLGCPRFFSGLS